MCSSLECYEYSEAAFGAQSVQPVDSDGKGEELRVDECGITAVPLIVGGTKAAPMEFPHMVRQNFLLTAKN